MYWKFAVAPGGTPVTEKDTGSGSWKTYSSKSKVNLNQAPYPCFVDCETS